MQQRVRITSSWTMSFVCQTTPHFDSTSREVSYSVREYHTRKQEKSKSPFSQIFEKAGDFFQSYRFLWIMMKFLDKTLFIRLIFVRYCFIMVLILGKEGKPWAN